MSEYAAFLAKKADAARGSGIPFAWAPIRPLHPFQTALTEWSLGLGRAAIFADCGLGKTPIQLTWAENVIRATNKPVLILTPLAVGAQTLREAEKFGVEAYRWRPEAAITPSVWIANYEKLHKIDPSRFAAIVADESSILKNFDGVRREEVTHAMRRVMYRLLCTATAAPNDYIELGTSSEALGHLGHTDILTRFFVNDQNSSHPNRLMSGAKWRFRGYAEIPFWRWIATWARACRRPSDLGFDDGPFQLPPLQERYHVVSASTLPPGQLFQRPATDMQEERQERRRTLTERCERVAELVADTGAPAVVWCHLNPEGDLLERLIGSESVQVSGDDTDEQKEEAFESFTSGTTRVLITKPKIGAWGLNWQHCAHVVTFASHSFEQQYQSIRRCWRFGQSRAVVVDLVLSEGEQRVLANLRRKAAAADAMFTRLVAHMREAVALEENSDTTPVEVPAWLL
jgi:hypothetical protein